MPATHKPTAAVRRNRSFITGKFLRGCRLITPEGYWVGPGLGDFRNAAQARAWAARNGYAVS